MFVISSQYVFMSATPDEELISRVQTKKIDIRDNVPFNIESRITKALNMEEVEDKTIAQECQRYILNMATDEIPWGNILCFCIDQIECQDVLRAVTAALRRECQNDKSILLNVIDLVPDIRNSTSMDELRQKILMRCEKNMFNVVPMILTEKTIDLFQQLAREDISDNCYKLILSNSVAESTVTIPHLAVVIDSGLAKENVWVFDKNVYEQQTVLINNNMATQRKGRVGRTMDGISVKVELSDKGNLQVSRPEVKRMDITNAVLKLYSVKLDIEQLNTWLPSKIDPEEISRIKYMFEKMDLVENGEITPRGSKISQYDQISIQQADVLISFPRILDVIICVFVQMVINRFDLLFPDIHCDILTANYYKYSDIVTAVRALCKLWNKEEEELDRVL